MSAQVPLLHRAAQFAAASIAVVALPSVAAATLTIDVRATGGTGGIIVINPKLFVASTAGPGDTLSMDVYALIHGTDTADGETENGVLSFSGSFLSSPNAGAGFRGTLAAQRAATMMGAGGSNGLQQDLDGDGDLDVGSNTNTSANNFFSARSTDAPAPQWGVEIFVGTLTFTLTQFTALAPTEINFRPRVADTAASWFEAGMFITSSDFSAGTPVREFTPEPASAALIGGALSFGLLARRRDARGRD